MSHPTTIDLDLETDAGYVTYRDGQLAKTLEVWHDGQVAADLDASGEVLGIEILGFDAATLAQAKRFASERSLAFPNLKEVTA